MEVAKIEFRLIMGSINLMMGTMVTPVIRSRGWGLSCSAKEKNRGK